VHMVRIVRMVLYLNKMYQYINDDLAA
jgi:hypothetical protein